MCIRKIMLAGFVSFCVTAVLFAKKADFTNGLEIALLDDPNLYSITDSNDKDPLLDVAEDIRSKIDPRLDPNWPHKWKEEFTEYINSIQARYDEFWKLIPCHSRLLVDLDNDGIDELFVISQGLNDDTWGFANFFCILKRKIHYPKILGSWELSYFQPIEPSLDWDRPGMFMAFQLSVCDFDRNGRKDIMFTYMKIGASASAHYLRILSISTDMKLRDHELWSRKPVTVLDPGSLRPVLIQHNDDGYLPEDCGASVRGRGYRRAYFQWTVEKGFYDF
jgi:hypothetical protein